MVAVAHREVVRVALELGRVVLREYGQVREPRRLDAEPRRVAAFKVELEARVRRRHNRPAWLDHRAGRVAEGVCRSVLQAVQRGLGAVGGRQQHDRHRVLCVSRRVRLDLCRPRVVVLGVHGEETSPLEATFTATVRLLAEHARRRNEEREDETTRPHGLMLVLLCLSHPARGVPSEYSFQRGVFTAYVSRAPAPPQSAARVLGRRAMAEDLTASAAARWRGAERETERWRRADDARPRPRKRGQYALWLPFGLSVWPQTGVHYRGGQTRTHTHTRSPFTCRGY